MGDFEDVTPRSIYSYIGLQDKNSIWSTRFLNKHLPLLILGRLETLREQRGTANNKLELLSFIIHR